MTALSDPGLDLMYAEQPVSDQQWGTVFSSDGRSLLSRAEETFIGRDWDRPNFWRAFQVESLRYSQHLMVHQLKRIAKQYSETLQAFGGVDLKDASYCSINGQYELYFAFDDAVTAAVRATECLRPFIWYGSGETGDLPRSFKKTIEAAGEIPPAIRSKIDSTSELVAKAKAYRDCVQHNFSPALAGGAFLIRSESGLSLLTTRLPDNPEAKSARRFTYDRKIDAQIFARDMVEQVISLFEVIVEHLAPQEKPHGARV